jgi:hypothetical protein
LVIVGQRRSNSNNSSNIIGKSTVASFKNKPKRKVYTVEGSTGFCLLEPEKLSLLLQLQPTQGLQQQLELNLNSKVNPKRTNYF